MINYTEYFFDYLEKHSKKHSISKIDLLLKEIGYDIGQDDFEYEKICRVFTPVFDFTSDDNCRYVLTVSIKKLKIVLENPAFTPSKTNDKLFDSILQELFSFPARTVFVHQILADPSTDFVHFYVRSAEFTY